MTEEIIVIDHDANMWNQNGKLKFSDSSYATSIRDKNFPIKILVKDINYVIDKGHPTYGYTTVKEILIDLKDGYLILWNKCARSFIAQYKGKLLEERPRSVLLQEKNT